MTENRVFDEIYKRYKNLVLKVAYLYVKDLDTANDMMQDTFLALYKDMSDKGIEAEEEYSNIKSWLYATVSHYSMNYLKKSARIVSADAMKEDDTFEEPFRMSSEEEYLDERTEEDRLELHRRIFTALLEKNPRWHEAIMLACYLEISQKEAARRMGISENAFYVMLHRAREWIIKEFGVEYEELSRL